MRRTGPAPTVHDVLTRAATGSPLDVEQAETLLAASGDDLDALLHAASALRDEGLARAGRAGMITYSRKVFVPLTTLCRDRCHYCVFVDTPGQLLLRKAPLFMSREQVVSLARQGAALGCKEALFTLGDRPEDRWPEAREWLDEHGYASTLDYVADMARAVLDETGLLPHMNPGVMSADELEALRPLAPSMGMMLETTSRRLFEERGQVHYGSPDKDPALRLRVIDDAGAARIPFTTGILVGIGETLRDRAESLIAIRDANDRHRVDGLGHVQETIVQNFRAKPRTAAAGLHDAELGEYLAAGATARLVMGADARIQAPPNLSDPTEFALLVRAGVDDWGGVSPLTADHVNPERPWPHVDDLARLTADAGFELRERLTAHPEYLRAADTWLDPAMAEPTMALADPETLLANRRDSAIPPSRHPGRGNRGVSATGLDMDEVLARAQADPAGLGDDEYALLLTATGEHLDTLTGIADLARRHTVGETITLVVNRNLTSSGLRSLSALRLAPLAQEPRSESKGVFTLDDAAAIAADAQDLGATELCIQGLLPPDQPATGYLELARVVKASAPGLHLHAFRPQDVDDLATRGGMGLARALDALREAGVDTMPGTGVKVLDEAIRRRVAPNDLPIDRWLEIVETAHKAGFRTSSVLFFGHVESAADRVAHLRTLLAMQDRTGGFTEFVPIPAPAVALAPGSPSGIPLVPGRSSIDEARAQMAVARLMLTGRIQHLQVPWPRLSLDDARVLLRSGGDDLGGALLDGRVLPEAGVEHGRELLPADAQRLAHTMLRGFRLRTTTYADPGAERSRARMVSDPTGDRPGGLDGDPRTIAAPNRTSAA
jgi:FO synthase